MSKIQEWSNIEGIFWTVSVLGGLWLGYFIASDPVAARARRLERRRKRVSKAIERLYLAENSNRKETR
jgi:lipid-A-disaccharide synthase-like uncharacterized protein